MTLFRTLVILALVAAILGGASYFSYELFWKQKKLDREDREARVESAEPSAPPDYSLPAFEKASELLRSGKTDDAKAALAQFINDYPDSVKVPGAKTALADINMGWLFSPDESPEKTAYSVAKGDSLVKIASKFNTNAELIFRVNNMENINLQIGQQLFIPKLDTSIVVDRAGKTVTLLNQGQFFKEYPVQSLKIPGGSAVVATKVTDKVALQGADRVAFGDKKYAGSERWLMLASNGIVIRGQSGEGAAPAGIVLSAPDMEEVFILVSRGAPVTIK